MKRTIFLILFWLIFLTLPLGTSMIHYRYAPHESISGREDEYTVLEKTVDCCDRYGKPIEINEVWMNNLTRKIYRRTGFNAHKRREIIRITLNIFLYGLMGCYVYAYDRKKTYRYDFRKGFNRALGVNCIITLCIFLMAWSKLFN